MIKVIQSIDKQELEQSLVTIGEELREKSDLHSRPNNWLKIHGKVMRRKPLKRRWMMIDEFYRFFDDETLMRYYRNLRDRFKRVGEKEEYIN